ncbi:alpha/beta fold hydrolase [Clavibacter michiganensis]|uniref:alpha/beta fold hydrolase n=1 Tax=Clavibacter michiganensis TaxID=28447 RepID=UPI0026DAB954|nr:alpha/beta hydrolase [Clavibacter michiganensis]MDO4032850.1 alpha/beta hydrolase [Clavibacter michiganensis]
MTTGLPGRDVTVTTPDGRRLRAMVAGARDDLVVLEAGLGGSGLTWGLVHGILARTHRVVAYDRAGLGGSDTDPAPRDLDRLADDLEAVIAAFPHRRLVLAGHSWGGPVVRVVAARRIARGLATAGVVLVDPSDERARGYGSAAARIGFATQAALVVPLARLGLLRRLHRMALAGLPEPLLGGGARPPRRRAPPRGRPGRGSSIRRVGWARCRARGHEHLGGLVMYSS